MLTKNFVTFPQEVIDGILDAVAELDTSEIYYIHDAQTGSTGTPVLYSCALTSRSFLPRARKHIFRQIMLCPGTALELGRAFRNPLRPTPRKFAQRVSTTTAALVESVILVGEADKLYLGDADQTTDLEEWAANDPNLRRVFASFQTLRTIIFRRFEIRSSHTTSLQRVFRAGLGIAHVVFNGVDMESQPRAALNPILFLFPQMTSLRIQGPPIGQYWHNALFYNATQTENYMTVTSPLSSLRTLCVSGLSEGGLLGLLDCPWPISLDRITRLEYAPVFTPIKLVNFMHLVERITALEDLDFDLSAFGQGVLEAEGPLPSRLPFENLLSLSLSVSAPTTGATPLHLMDVPVLWDTYIRSLAIATHLQDLQVRIIFTEKSHNASKSNGHWTDLPGALLRVPTLCRVRFVVVNKVGFDHDQRMQECLSFYEKMLEATKEGQAFHELSTTVDVQVELEGIWWTRRPYRYYGEILD